MTVPLETVAPEIRRDVVTEMVRGLCHDMRQPLATIMALSSTGACTNDGDERVTQVLSRISTQATELLDMIRSTLDEEESRREPVNVPALLADIVADRRLTFDGAISISCMNAERAVVRAVPCMLRRAVVNLVDNAARAAGPDGNVRVAVVGKRSHVDVVVEDDGPGFGRIPSGTGIGLDVVQRVAADCGGRLQIRSGESGGVRARLRLARLDDGGAGGRG